MQSRSDLRFWLTALALTGLLIVAGCGDQDDDGGERPPAATAATGATGQGPASEPATTGGPSSEIDRQHEPGEPGTGDEEPAGTPVELRLEGGGLADGVPANVHVPPFIAVLLDLRAVDGDSYRVRVRGPGDVDMTLAVAGNGRRSVPLEGLRAGESYRITVGDSAAVRVTADAEPGP